jgi:hypothetical protein
VSAHSTARVPTANGSRYLQQLCKHSENFKHVSAQNQSLIIPAEIDPTH